MTSTTTKDRTIAAVNASGALAVIAQTRHIEASEVTPTASFADLDPTTLLIESNVRAQAGLTARFLDSIRENGVLMPILVQRTPEGLHVRAGQRRTLADPVRSPSTWSEPPPRAVPCGQNRSIHIDRYGVRRDRARLARA